MFSLQRFSECRLIVTVSSFVKNLIWSWLSWSGFLFGKFFKSFPIRHQNLYVVLLLRIVVMITVVVLIVKLLHM